MRLKTQLLLGNAPILIIMIAIVIVMYANSESRQNTQRWVEHTYEVIAHANLLVKLLVDMETGQRGFLITGKEEFLEPYYGADQIYKKEFEELQNLVSDNPEQVTRLHKINSLAHEWHISTCVPAIRARRHNEELGVVLENFEIGAGKEILDLIRVRMDEFIGIERGLLAERIQDVKSSARRNVYLSTSVAFIAVLTSFVLMFYTSRRILRRVGGEPIEIARLAEEIANGNLDVQIEHGTGILASVGKMLDSLKENRLSLEELNSQLIDKNLMLDESISKLKDAQRIASVGSWELNLVNDHLDWSDEIYRIFEINRTDFSASYEAFLDAIHPDDRLMVNEAYTNSLQDQEPYEITHRLKMKDGRIKFVHERGETDFNGDGKPLLSKGTVQDITLRKIAEDEREHLAEELENKNAELEQIVYVTSHDLRSPLLNIQGFSKELKLSLQELAEIVDAERNVNELKTELSQLCKIDIPDMLQYIESSTTKMDLLLSGLLKLSRLGRSALEPKQLEMNVVIADVIAAMEYRLKEIGAEIEQKDLPECWGDEIQINQVFTNLLDNAIKFRDPCRQLKINIDGSKNNGNITYTVEDNGVGIRKAHQRNIFDVFHRLDPEETEGEGLGLTIIRRILQRHSGTIEVESEVGLGSRFTVVLPLKIRKLTNRM